MHVHQQAVLVVGGAVVDVQTVCLRLGKPEQHARALGLLGQLRHPPVIGRDRDVLLEIPDRVATERQLGENHQLGALADRLGDHLLGTCDVGLELAGAGVDLRERNAHHYLLDR
jgi:hypothetical protein